MAKTKTKDTKRKINPHLHARVAYLHRAANYLVSLSQDAPNSANGLEGALEKANDHVQDVSNQQSKLKQSRQDIDRSPTTDSSMTASQSSSRHLASSLRSVARKSQIRLSRDVKHSMCKVCDSVLIEGQTSTTSTENNSRGGRKPWAEVSCITCHACGAVKRFPVGATRQSKKGIRSQAMQHDQKPPSA